MFGGLNGAKVCRCCRVWHAPFSVLAQPVSASAAERNWSVYGAIKSDKRSRLSHDNADRLVYCHEALSLRTKLEREHGGYKRQTLKWATWESDSDSNCSGG